MGQIGKERLYQEFDQIIEVMTNAGYPKLVRDSTIGAIHCSKNQEETLAKVRVLLAEKPSPREMIKALQPIYREDCGIRSRKEQS